MGRAGGVALLAAAGWAGLACAPRLALATADVNGLWCIGVYVTELSHSYGDLCAVNVTQTGRTC